MIISDEDFISLREDVIFIKVHIERIDDHESRLRRLEKVLWGLPASILASVAAFLGFNN